MQVKVIHFLLQWPRGEEDVRESTCTGNTATPQILLALPHRLYHLHSVPTTYTYHLHCAALWYSSSPMGVWKNGCSRANSYQWWCNRLGYHSSSSLPTPYRPPLGGDISTSSNNLQSTCIPLTLVRVLAEYLQAPDTGQGTKDERLVSFRQFHAWQIDTTTGMSYHSHHIPSATEA